MTATGDPNDGGQPRASEQGEATPGCEARGRPIEAHSARDPRGLDGHADTDKTWRMNRTRSKGCGEPAATPLKRCVSEELARYFEALEGEQPCDLHKMVIAETEQALLQFVLAYTGGNQSRAAQLLGLNRGTLRKKLAYYAIEL